MNKLLITTVFVLVPTLSYAEKKYPENPVLRPLTLTDGIVSIGGGLSVIEDNDNKSGAISLYAAYGLTDNLTINLGGVDYRVLARKNNETGLELAVSAGLRGFQKSNVNGDSIAYGANLNGKYVFNSSLAMNFSLGLIKWDEEKISNKDEYRYSVGLQTKLAKGWTTHVNYTYRDLKYFEQNDAHVINAGLNYSFSKSVDLGGALGYSDFDAVINGYDLDNSFERSVGVYVGYRF